MVKEKEEVQNGRKQQSKTGNAKCDAIYAARRKVHSGPDGRIAPYETSSGDSLRIGTGVESVYSLDADIAREFAEAGITPMTFHKLVSGSASAGLFYEAISTAKEILGDKAASVYVYPLVEYENMTLFLSEIGKSGVAIKPDGDVVSVFSAEGHKGVGYPGDNSFCSDVDEFGRFISRFIRKSAENYLCSAGSCAGSFKFFVSGNFGFC